ncbi:hypothetical protein [Actinomyces oris]|uniref:hypothetical protein n=1 Tax=Actinomyces oris TaxID=544580 RepID=UPI000B100A50|nr:hypothetical protein [Actinomyces oris]
MYTSPDQAPRLLRRGPQPAPYRPHDRPGPHQHGNSHQHGKSHHWMHLLMCAPMLLVVAGYLWAGRASLAAGGVLAALVPAISCMLMMWLMMRMIDHGSQH